MDIKQLEQIKEQGNNLFKQKDLKSAEIAFKNGVDIIEKCGQNVSENKELKTIFFQLSTNLALCHLNQNHYFETIQICNKVLKIDPENKKALYRRALANKGQAETQTHGDSNDVESLKVKDGLYSQARADLEKLNTLEENKNVKQELSNIVKESVKIKILLKNINPNYQGDQKKKEQLEQQQNQESEVEEVIINKNKKDIRNHDNYKVIPNFTLQQLNEVSKNAFQTMANQILTKNKIPSTTFEFEQDFDTFKKHLDKLYLYIKKIPSDTYQKIYEKKIFQQCIFLLMVKSIKQYGQTEQDFLFNEPIDQFYGIKGLFATRRNIWKNQEYIQVQLMLNADHKGRKKGYIKPFQNYWSA